MFNKQLIGDQPPKDYYVNPTLDDLEKWMRDQLRKENVTLLDDLHIDAVRVLDRLTKDAHTNSTLVCCTSEYHLPYEGMTAKGWQVFPYLGQSYRYTPKIAKFLHFLYPKSVSKPDPANNDRYPKPMSDTFWHPVCNLA